MVYDIAKILVLPPTCFFVLFLLGLLLAKWRRRLGQGFLWALMGVVYLSTTPYLAGELMAPLQPYAPLDADALDHGAEAIVVLGAGAYFGAPEYQQTQAAPVPTAGGLTLQRVQYAAFLAKITGLPVLVSGGSTGFGPGLTVAKAMKTTLERDFGVTVRWSEDLSRSTFLNARLSAVQLREAGIERFYLVTNAWHMPRAMLSFEGTGLQPIPAPTRFVSQAEPVWRDFLPSVGAFNATYYAVHEWLGLAWYRLRR